MKCIYCAGSTHVTNSRPSKKTAEIWRRRKCLACGAVITTSEHPDLEKSLVVTQPSRRLRPFNRDQLLLSIAKACGHRNDTAAAASALTETVVNKLLLLADHGSIDKRQIVKITEGVLTRFDKAAGIQYTAYHTAKDI